MTDTRSIAIKRALKPLFAPRKIRARARGSWTHITIDWTPLDREAAREKEAACFALLNAAKIDLGRFFTDDTCQTESSKCFISFNEPLFFRTIPHSDGSLGVQDDPLSPWRTIPAALDGVGFLDVPGVPGPDFGPGWGVAP